MEQTLCVPFPEKEFGDNLDELLSWLDSTESLSSTGVSCNNDAACGYGFCDKDGSGASYKCMTHVDPEIRGSGYTPIARVFSMLGSTSGRIFLWMAVTAEPIVIARVRGIGASRGLASTPFVTVVKT